ncbi:hypothetical protein ACSMEV_10135 [Pseudomonas sp. MLB6B]|uniref:hypothetical protein n=1 Tax=unclassified Pseudomonas TaxID=196821 RepID=UPI0025FD8375|nr:MULTISPECIES: hypothetical protein [unclassified Pseudomonas]
MKKWDIIFADQKGELTTLQLTADQRPGEEEAARAIRSSLFPVMDELDLNDFQDRSVSPTARWLKEHSGVTIAEIVEHP